MKNLMDNIAFRFVQLVVVWVTFALLFDVFMIITHFVNPELNTKIGNEIMWRIDGTFKDSPDNIWYEGPKK